MTDISINRRFEFWIILSAILSYVVRTLLWSAWHFEYMIRTALAEGIHVKDIWDDLRNYEHEPNFTIPFIMASVSIFSAWYLLHSKVVPKLRYDSFDWRSAMQLVFALLLIITAAAAMGNIKSLGYRYNDSARIIGLDVISNFRKRYVLSDSATLLAIIGIYEMLFQLSSRIYRKVKIGYERRKLNYIILASVCLILFVFTISWEVVPSLFYSIVSREVWAFLLFICLVYVLQDYYYRKVHAVMHNPHLSGDQYYPILIFTASIVAATFIIWAVMARFQTNAPTFVIFASMALYFSSMVIAYLRKNQQKEQTILQTQVSVKSAELSSLRSQINPHFLFNALNSLYATALKENSEQTADGIQKLGDMMRFMLHENNHEQIPLWSEIEYLHNYIDIQRMRLDESQNIEIRVNIQNPETDVQIAPMLLNPFIENAFKHGISLQHKSWIYITLTMDHDRIYFKVHNALHPSLATNPEKDKSGIGLENVKKRLELIYPKRHTLDIQRSNGDFFVALTLDYKQS